MVGFLKYAHLAFFLAAIALFVAAFYWQQSGHKNAQRKVFKKILLHTHLTILLLGLLLVWAAQINPFAEKGLWVIEKLGAFVAYMLMVFAALDENRRKGLRFLTFMGAFGWLAYIVTLAISKQAILLVG